MQEVEVYALIFVTEPILTVLILCPKTVLTLLMFLAGRFLIAWMFLSHLVLSCADVSY